jgi:hypothetical protein
MDGIRRKPFIYTDFVGPANSSTLEASLPWEWTANSSGTTANIAAEASHPGIIRISSSTTTNSGGRIVTDAASLLLAGGETFEVVFQPKVASNTNTTMRFGFIDTASSSDVTDGCYFELPAGSFAIVGKCANNGTRTTSSTIATLAVNTWYHCKVELNSGATQADFTCWNDSGTQLGTQSITTNIPTATGRETGHGFIATNSGTTATLLVWLDWFGQWYATRALTRGK